MAKCLLTIRLLCFIGPAFSQVRNSNTWRLTIADSANNKGIAQAAVDINGKSSLAADAMGNVYVDKESLKGRESITVSCIGYKTFSISALKNLLPDTIRLAADITLLGDVNISEPQSKIYIGNLQAVYKGSYLPDPSFQMAKYIPNTKKIRGIVNTLLFRINDRRNGIGMPFRARLYRKNDSNLYPAQEIITDSIIVYNPKRQELVSVNISKYHLELPENGLFVIFETLPMSRYDKDQMLEHGRRVSRVPCLDENPSKIFNSPDYLPGKDTSYCLLNTKANDDDPYWEMLDPGLNFGIGAIVIQE